MGVIFDLDETLVNTTAAEKELEEEKFQEAENYIGEFSMYSGIPELLRFIKEYGIKMAIVSTSPRDYCEKVIRRFKMDCRCIVAKGETAEKPSPEPMLKALEMLGLNADQCVSFGDRAKDIVSSNEAGIYSIACLWGHEGVILKKSNPSALIADPLEAIHVIKNFFSL